MEKNNVVLVVLNVENLDNTVKSLNLENANLAAIIVDNAKKTLPVDGKEIPAFTFANLQAPIKKYKNYLWLVSGESNNVNDFHKIKNFLVMNGLPEKNISSFKSSWQPSDTWFANLRYVEEHGTDFFATGNEYMRDSLNLKFIPRVYADETANRGGNSFR